jgi:hypothetical protein
VAQRPRNTWIRNGGSAITALSALLCLIFAASTLHWYLQSRSDFYPSFLRWSPTSQTDFAIQNGLHVGHRTDAVENNTHYPNTRQTIDWHVLGFRFNLVRQVYYPRWVSHGDNQTIEWGPIATWAVGFPGWACVLATGVLPASAMRRYLRRRREAKVHAGICVRCGYDLRASPEKCPECGTPRPRVERTRVAAGG